MHDAAHRRALRLTPNLYEALLAYEYAITFDQEIALFWKPKMTGDTVLFLGTRYTALLSYDFMLTATFSPLPDQVRRPISFSIY